MKAIHILTAAAVLFAVSAFCQEVQIKEQNSFTYAYLDCSGSYMQIPAKIGEFIGHFFKQGLTPSGPMLGLYFNSPDAVKETDLKWAIGFQVSSKSAVNEPLKKGEFKSTTVAYYLYKGPFDKVGDAYTKIMQQISEKGYFPAGPFMEYYLDDPGNTKPEELRTEIIIPVAKK